MNETEKIYSVIVNDSSKLMMFEHITFLSQVSITAAENLYESFKKAFTSLSKFPHRCPVFEAAYVASQYRHIIVDRYTLLFTIDEQKSIVSIEYIWDKRQNSVII
jgi:plasmid stabilization system protein ParE